jgi:DNA polymerase-3 subunit alpha
MRFTLEDYTGTRQFALFGKDYENFSKYIQSNHALLLHCFFQKRFRAQGDNRPDEWELRIRSIHYLAHVRDELIRNIHLTIPVEEMTELFVERLAATAANNKGKIDMQIGLTEKANNIAVDVFSRTFRIELTSDFLTFIQSENLAYKLNV